MITVVRAIGRVWDLGRIRVDAAIRSVWRTSPGYSSTATMLAATNSSNSGSSLPSLVYASLCRCDWILCYVVVRQGWLRSPLWLLWMLLHRENSTGFLVSPWSWSGSWSFLQCGSTVASYYFRHWELRNGCTLIGNLRILHNKLWFKRKLISMAFVFKHSLLHSTLVHSNPVLLRFDEEKGFTAI